MREELILKIKTEIMPEELRAKCLDLIEKCHDEVLLSFLNQLFGDYFAKRTEAITLGLKKDPQLSSKLHKTLNDYEETQRSTDADDFLKTTQWA